MTGGSKGVCARNRAQAFSRILVGGQTLLTGATLLLATHAYADTSSDEGDPCDPAQVAEQSIVVAGRKLAVDADDYTVVADSGDDDVLEPIANVSQYVPDLADSPHAAPAGPASREGTDDSVVPRPEQTQASDDLGEDASPRVVARPSSFQGVTPGLTTRDEVLSEWGMPVSGGARSPRLVYELAEFPDVEVLLTGDQVNVLRVTLAKEVETERLVETLELGAIRPLKKAAPGGGLAATLFPERGVALLHEPGPTIAFASDDAPSARYVDPSLVHRIEVRSLSGDDFAARAAQSPHYAYAERSADLAQAIELDRSDVESLITLSQIKLLEGEAATAEQLAAAAIAEAPQAIDPQLQRARCLTRLARYDEAVDQTRAVLESLAATPLQRAQGLHQMGLLATFGSDEINKRSVPLQTKAIELADPLAADSDLETRRAAKQLLVTAHLAIAEQIARGEYQKKDEFVAQWVGRASALAEEMISAGDADVALRLELAVSALAAAARLHPPIDPSFWVDEAEEAVAQLRSEIDDDRALAVVDWNLGTVYFYATEIMHRRGDSDSALRYGDVASALMAPLAGQRDQLPDSSFMMGRLYFQIGAVHAVHRDDHREACTWYDRAVDCLLTPYPVTTMATPGQHGDALVSMGVSYWRLGRRDRAYELTRAGAELIEQGESEGLLASGASEVASDNLAAMAKALGKPADRLARSEPAPTAATVSGRRTVRR